MEICLLQNLYNKRKENRTMNQNRQYSVIFKNPRDQQHIPALANIYFNSTNITSDHPLKVSCKMQIQCTLIVTPPLKII